MFNKFNTTSINELLQLINDYVYNNSSNTPAVEFNDISNKYDQLFLFDQPINNDKDIIKILKEYINNNE